MDKGKLVLKNDKSEDSCYTNPVDCSISIPEDNGKFQEISSSHVSFFQDLLNSLCYEWINILYNNHVGQRHSLLMP